MLQERSNGYIFHSHLQTLKDLYQVGLTLSLSKAPLPTGAIYSIRTSGECLDMNGNVLRDGTSSYHLISALNINWVVLSDTLDGSFSSERWDKIEVSQV